MVLVKTQHTEVSFDPSARTGPQEPRRPRFSFCLQFSNSVHPDTEDSEPARINSPDQTPCHHSEARQQPRSAAAPSRWAVYRRGLFGLSTTFLKVFRLKDVFVIFQYLTLENGLSTGLRTPIFRLFAPDADGRKGQPFFGGAQSPLPALIQTPFPRSEPPPGSRSGQRLRRSAGPAPDAMRSPRPVGPADRYRRRAVAGPAWPCRP